MIAADRPHSAPAKLLFVDAGGVLRHVEASALASLLEPGDLVVANDAATLPASLRGVHEASGAPIEVRLAGWISLGDVSRFTAIVFGGGDHHTRTEDRPAPPPLLSGDCLSLGPLRAIVERTLDHPRLIALRFDALPHAIWEGIARHGRPIQYAHVPETLALWDVWTRVASVPAAFEPPSAGFVLDWAMLAALAKRGVGFATLTHAAGISSTGDTGLDRRLPFDEPYSIPESTAVAIRRAKAGGGRIVAIGTTVVRALEHAAGEWGSVCAGAGVATGRLGPDTPVRVVDAILSGVHAPGESHHDMLRAFVSDVVLERATIALEAHAYRNHEFGDFVLIERARRATAALRFSLTAA